MNNKNKIVIKLFFIAIIFWHIYVFFEQSTLLAIVVGFSTLSGLAILSWKEIKKEIAYFLTMLGIIFVILSILILGG